MLWIVCMSLGLIQRFGYSIALPYVSEKLTKTQNKKFANQFSHIYPNLSIILPPKIYLKSFLINGKKLIAANTFCC